MSNVLHLPTRFPNRGWLGEIIKKKIVKPATKAARRLPTADAMAALRDKYPQKGKGK